MVKLVFVKILSGAKHNEVCTVLAGFFNLYVWFSSYLNVQTMTSQIIIYCAILSHNPVVFLSETKTKPGPNSSGNSSTISNSKPGLIIMLMAVNGPDMRKLFIVSAMCHLTVGRKSLPVNIFQKMLLDQLHCCYERNIILGLVFWHMCLVSIISLVNKAPSDWNYLLWK